MLIIDYCSATLSEGVFFFCEWINLNFSRLVVFNQVMGVSIVSRLLDHVADYMTERSYPGPVQDLLGEVKSLVGEG